MVPELADMIYEERLRSMGLPTLEQRRKRGDLKQVYKLMRGIEEVYIEKLVLREEFATRATRSHSKKLRNGRCVRDVKKYSFPQRCVGKWNGLSEDVVSAPSILP